MYKKEERLKLLERHFENLKQCIGSTVRYGKFDKIGYGMPTTRDKNVEYDNFILEDVINPSKIKIKNGATKYVVKAGRVYCLEKEEELILIKELIDIFPFEAGLKEGFGRITYTGVSTRNFISYPRIDSYEHLVYVKGYQDGRYYEGCYLTGEEIDWKKYILKY